MNYILTIICRERDKLGDRPAVTYVVKRDANSYDLNFFKLRGMYNPELSYYVVRSGSNFSDSEIIDFVERHNFKEPYAVRI